MKKLIIRNGLIIDGNNTAPFKGDIEIKGEKITKILPKIKGVGDFEFNAEGKIVSPGFIDPHSHADINILFAPENRANIMQGVTTFIGGNCGDSPVPMSDSWEINTQIYDKFNKIKPLYYQMINNPLSKEETLSQYKEHYGLDLNFSNFNDFIEKLMEVKISQNYYPLVGHSNLRRKVMGQDSNREASENEINKMINELRLMMKSGINGMSTGLDYPPGTFASKEEVIKIAEVLKEFEGIYSSHVRSRTMFVDGKPGFNQIQGIEEALNIGKKGVRIHISHVVEENNAEELLNIFDKAREEGIDVSFDVISNVSAGGSTFVYLATLLRPWYLAAGSMEQFQKNLKDSDYVNMMKYDMKNSKWYFTNEAALPGVEEAIKIVKHKEKKYINKTVKDIMNECGENYQDTLINIISTDVWAKINYGAPSKEERHEQIKALLDHDFAIPASDTYAANENSIFGLAEPLNMLPHTNTFTYAIRYLTKYRRETLEKTIHAMTGLVAERFNIKKRGVLAEGNYADIVVFDIDNLDININPEDPRSFPIGIDLVIVNGEITAINGSHTGARNGKVLLKE